MTPNLSHCRFCAESNKTENLIDLTTDEKILEDYRKKLDFLKIDFINLDSNILLNTICRSCCKSLQDACDFFLKIKQAQFSLHNLYRSSEDLFELTLIKEEKSNDVNCEDSDTEPKLVMDLSEGDLKIDPCPYTNVNNPLLNLKMELIVKNKYELDSTILAVTNPKKRKLKTDSNIKKLDSCTKVSTDFTNLNISWIEYYWTCVHCEAKFDSMEELRDHSKMVHTACYGFKCMDCEELFNYFNPFIEHVRQHRECLRLYCQYCNVRHSTPELTLAHSITHFRDVQVCELCGEQLSNSVALDRHRKAYKKIKLPQRCYKKKPHSVKCDITWNEYEWACQDCSLRCPSVSALRRHTRDSHGKCFAIKCADCLLVMTNFKHFIDHASAHRSCLKDYCQFCNAHLPNIDGPSHLSSHYAASKPCEGCGEEFPDSASLARHMTLYDAPRVRGSCSNESLTCGVCHKYFTNAFQLKNHKVIHNNQRERDQICHTCGKAFYDRKTLTNHIKIHFNKTEVCKICKKSFLTKQRLKMHIGTHLEVKEFVCNECGKEFRRKSQLRLHLVSHSNILPFQCLSCQKSFRLLSYLKIHERQHTGLRPYTCEICKESFNHWGNCNRHMIRKHGVTIAKTKITKHGKLDINRETGEAKEIHLEGDAKEYCDEMLKPKKRGRKRKSEAEKE